MKVKNRTSYTNENGITLIALVITIVVLLILAAVSISAIFGENGIIKKAQSAQSKMNEAENSDLAAINGLNDWMKKQTGENEIKIDEDIAKLKTYTEANKVNGILTENARYVSGSNIAIIPKGFKVSSVDKEKTIDNGLVIQDKDENEFVWIPVNYVATGDLDADGLDSGFKATFKKTSEPNENGYGINGTEERTDYIKMMQSVQKNKGFYIGRYEAGSVNENGENVARTESTDTSSKVVVKRNAYPYIYVGWGNTTNDIETEVATFGNGAVYLSKHMYDQKDIGATSTLCYGVQWEAAINFGRSFEGNYMNNPWTINNTKAKYADSTSARQGNWTQIPTGGLSKTNYNSFLLTTGASDNFKAKNIFDLAGNVYEWTMESTGNNRAFRGGYYGGNSSSHSVSYKEDTNPSNKLRHLGFRPALYL